ncbi:hypothetical protein [Streptomyces sp. NPDC088766]|uniref:hypothetical protein n=1 Tax=Streptomyces sp. NPDC088766 TaxID=3365893 RepID=UPI0038252DE4
MASAETFEDRHDDGPPPAPAPTTPAEWDDLIREWDDIRHGYYLGDAAAMVRACAENLEASVAAGGPDTALWTLGLMLTGPYVVYARPDAAAEARVSAAMGAVERALGQTSCAHEEHPCDEILLDAESDHFRWVLEMLAHPERDAAHEADLADEGLWPDDEGAQSWYEGRMTRDVWACPQNLAGLARSFPG